MKLAITADVHLQSREETPERWGALANILDQMLSENIQTLIIAGDLFDAKSQNYSEFDEFCKQEKYKKIDLYIIPGNHDELIGPHHLTAPNIKVFSGPKVTPLGERDVSFLFIPYSHDKSIGEVMAEHANDLPDPWVLIGHGDYITGLHEPNPYEPGIYMPLARRDIESFDPTLVILGHIHKKLDSGKVHYPGSSCSIDISETGKRKFLIMDTNNFNLSTKTIDTDYIYFDETLIAVPVTNEFDLLRTKIKDMIKGWNLSEREIPKTRLRLKIKGYTSDKNNLLAETKKALSEFTFYNGEEPDLTEVSVLNDPERLSIVEKVKGEIEKLEWDGEVATKEDILEQTLHIILRE